MIIRRSNRIWIGLMGALIGAGALGFGVALLDDSVNDPLANAEPLIVTIGYGDIENAIAAPGEIASPAQAADPDTLTVATEVFETDVGAVLQAVAVYFTTLRSPESRWYGSGIRVGPDRGSADGAASYTVLFDVDNASGEIVPGMATQSFFVTSAATDVLVVPVGALRFADGAGETRLASVEAVRPDGRIESRDVVVGARDRVSAEVISGLAAGDRVVAGTLIPERGITEAARRPGSGRGRADDRFFEPMPGARRP